MTKTSCSITLTAAFAALVAFAPQIAAKTIGSAAVAQKARETLKDLRLSASTAAGLAERLQMLAENPEVSSDTHYTSLMDLRHDVNTMGKEVAALEAQRSALEPWEQDAVDKVVPLLKETAQNTQSAILYFNANRAHLWTAAHKDYNENVERDSNEIAKTLETYLK